MSDGVATTVLNGVAGARGQGRPDSREDGDSATTTGGVPTQKGGTAAGH